MNKIQHTWQSVRNYFLPTKNELPSWGTDLTILLIQERDRILTIMLRLTSLFGILGIFSVMGNLFKRERWDLVLTYLAGMFIVGIISYLRQINYVIRSLTFLSIVFFMGVIDLSFFGVAEDWRLYFSGFTILTTVFLGWRKGVGAMLLSLAAFVTIAWQISVGRIVITASAMVSPVPNLENIITFSLVFVMTNGVLITAVSALLNEFERVSKKEREAASQLRQKTADLEQSLFREQQLANDVAVALHQEEALSQLRAKIITTISHEFRTPLAVINNSANLLNKYEDRLSDEKRHQQFERISESIQYLTNLLKDVSLVSNQQAETTTLQLETIPFGMLHHRLKTELLEETGYPENLQFTAVGPPSHELILEFALLKQVLLNLLSNAIKYSLAQTPILLNIALTSNLTITLIDHGIGIPAEEKANIWELFYRGNNIEAQRGLGLGLFIVKQFLDKMNGSITLTDNPAGGSIFTIKLPKHPPNQSEF